ncbi:Immunoglobulin-like fold [Phytophthora cactorum]|nr:Immunoglobulin-like fold [Phytophthora cactorum]
MRPPQRDSWRHGSPATCSAKYMRRQWTSLLTVAAAVVLVLLLCTAEVVAKDVVTPRSKDNSKTMEMAVTVGGPADDIEETRKKPSKRNKTQQEPEVGTWHCFLLEASAPPSSVAQVLTFVLATGTAESLLADFDQDGHVGRREIQQIKDKLHHLLDTDESGGLDLSELKTRAQTDQDVAAALKKLDRDHDAVISWKELDERWESVGAEMTVAEVADWVAYAVQLPQYSEVIRANSISGYTFPLLMANDGARLQEIGVQSELHRHQLAMFLQMKYLGMGRKPEAVVSSVCTAERSSTQDKVLLQIAWVPAENTPQRYQLQRRSPGESTWMSVYSGADTEFLDVVGPDQHVVYRLTTWNSYGRSSHVFVRCEDASSASSAAESSPPLLSSSGKSRPSRSSSQSRNKRNSEAEIADAEEGDSGDDFDHRLSVWGLLKIYFWWLDDAIVILLVVMLPIRGIIYGDADSLLRLLRRLPPNMPTRVTVEVESSKTTVDNAAARVSWEKPVDNGVPIVCYTVRWTRTKTEEVKWIKLLAVPLPTTVIVEKLHHGETYKFVVQATNQFGLVTSSSRSTYMVPVPELKGKLRPRHLPAEKRALRNQCHVCHDPRYKKKVPFTATLDRRILHYCCLCDREFCHYHKGDVYHTKALSCPIVDGRCICITCKESRLHRTVTY